MGVSPIKPAADVAVPTTTAVTRRHAARPSGPIAWTAILAFGIVSIVPAGSAQAASRQVTYDCGRHTISGFQHYGFPSASMRDNATSSNEQCTSVQARVRVRTGAITVGQQEADNYTRHTHYPDGGVQWDYAWGRPYKWNAWRSWYGLGN